MPRVLKVINGLVLAAVIVFSLLVIATSLNIFGYRSYVDVSGSMAPAIDTGSMVFDHASPSYKDGDIITFHRAGTKDTITHRIVRVVTDADKSVFYKVKGDANTAPDPGLVPKSSVVGKVDFSVPYIGYFVGYLKTLPGLLIFIIIPAAIIIYRELANISAEVVKITRNSKKTTAKPDEPANARPKKGARIAIGIILLLAAGTVLGGSVSNTTRSSYDSSVNLSGNTITTGTW